MDTISAVFTAQNAFLTLKDIPAPKRGELIRIFGEVLREHKEMLSRCITSSVYKTIRESRGEVQEAIDMCDFAVGLSRQLYGLTMPSERVSHRIQEQWLPLGPVLVITAFNFPVAVWAWNFCLAVVCGNSVVWKPSEKATAVADMVQLMWDEACDRFEPDYLASSKLATVNTIIHGDATVGEQLVAHPMFPLVSATGSTVMGKKVGKIVGERLGRTLLELGGNNAVVVSQHADINLAVKGCVFGAVGTTGQRCTTTRRIYVHNSIIDEFLQKMVAAYKTITIGNPIREDVLLGPLVSIQSQTRMEKAVNQAVGVEHAKHVYGGTRIYPELGDDRAYVLPCILRVENHIPIMMEETFAPIVYVMPYSDIEDAITYVNASCYGLSNAIFTTNINEAERFMATAHSGLVNVNAGTSGAEIGGAFGGEKDTGGGRESGSDSWKNYMRRATSTINYSGHLPLAQGIVFE